MIDLLPDGSLSVRFPYDPLSIELVKAVMGRRWHKEDKFWSIPTAGLRFLQEQAARHGIACSLSEKVRAALNLGQRIHTAIDAAKADETPLELPTATQLMPFQFAGVRFAKTALHNFHGVMIADDMGLGKTIQALSIVAMHPKLQQVLVLCPNTLKYTWAGEIEKHYPQLSYTVIDGDKKLRPEQRTAESLIKICNYELLLRDVEPRLTEWDLVIGDEIANMLKSYKAKRTKLSKKLRRRYTIGLCGIPLENRLEELHSVMDFIMPGLLGSGWIFMQQHIVKNDYGIPIGYRGLDQGLQRCQY